MSLLKSLIPLYCGGLCDAVIMTPELALSWRVAYASNGVGIKPNFVTLAPPASNPATMASSTVVAVVRVS